MLDPCRNQKYTESTHVFKQHHTIHLSRGSRATGTLAKKSEGKIDFFRILNRNKVRNQNI